MIHVVTSNIHGCKNPSKYPLATNATQTARIKSVIIIIAFLFLPSTHAPASGVTNTDGTLFTPNITADQTALPVSSYTIHVEAIASIESPNRLIKAATIIFIYSFCLKISLYPIFLFCSMLMHLLFHLTLSQHSPGTFLIFYNK